ncbi:hypothetical protein TNCT_320741 [Trichonephila clavata]|uniref:Poly [ADP-ribose] polymerase n=1 Tax=Trichonephila clavata TaxID=2740835 RepID=A0A8X6H0G0_TRICU|nr:hypothetical protein TNCT_320741 [Trichonephila clavata]
MIASPDRISVLIHRKGKLTAIQLSLHLTKNIEILMSCSCHDSEGDGLYTSCLLFKGICYPEALRSEAKVPCGPLISDPDYTGSLHYNEYIVYDVQQVKMKYLIRIKFNFK